MISRLPPRSRASRAKVTKSAKKTVVWPRVAAFDTLPRSVSTKIFNYFIQDNPWLFEYVKPFRRRSIAGYATLSRVWKDLIEAITFRNIVLTPYRINYALRTGILKRRFRHLRVVRLRMFLPAHDLSVSSNAEDYDSNAFFTRTIGEFCHLLAQVPYRDHDGRLMQPKIAVRLCVPLGRASVNRLQDCSFLVRKYPSVDELRGVAMEVRNRIQAGMDRAKKTYIEVDRGTCIRFPEMPMVSSFNVICDPASVQIAPSAACLIAMKMPRLKMAFFWLEDSEHQDLATRTRLRNGLADNLYRVPESVESFGLIYYESFDKGRTSASPESKVPDDRLSHTLFEFSQRECLVRLRLDGFFDPAILWPSMPGVKAYWQSLECYELSIQTFAPFSNETVNILLSDGAIPVRPSDMYTPYVDKLNDPYGFFMTVVKPDTQRDDFYFAAAKAVQHMPRLQEFRLGFQRELKYSTWEQWASVTNPELLWFRPRLKDPYKMGQCVQIGGDARIHTDDPVVQAWTRSSARHGRLFPDFRKAGPTVSQDWY